MRADGLEEKKSEGNDSENLERNDEILVHDEAQEDAEESLQDEDKISQADELSESEPEDGLVSAYSE